MLTIDGSLGEGGGQILRTALALSLVTGEAFRIEKIRAGRKKPGLLRQHLTAVDAATQIGHARAEGASLGSLELIFNPGKVASRKYQFAVGTAGSATLVLQTILPALLVAEGPSELVLEGGTHNPMAPPFDFLQKTFLPQIERMGPRVTATLERYGFYPAGGGRFSVAITPSRKLAPIELLERGEIKRRTARALLANLPRQIGERELKVVAEKTNWAPECLHMDTVSSPGPGNALILELESDALTEVFTGFGERGVLAESLAERLVKEMREYMAGGAPVGEYLADQLLLPMALAGGGQFRTASLSRHASTNMEIIQKFLPVRFQCEKEADGTRRMQCIG